MKRPETDSQVCVELDGKDARLPMRVRDLSDISAGSLQVLLGDLIGGVEIRYLDEDLGLGRLKTIDQLQAANGSKEGSAAAVLIAPAGPVFKAECSQQD